MSAKEILEKIKAVFAGEMPAPAAPADTTAPGSTVVYKTTDGTEITVTLKDPTVSAEPSVGDMVTIAGAPAAAGTLTLEDGSVFTVDATGAITAITTPDEGAQTDLGKNTQPAAAAPPAAPATPAAPVTKPMGMAATPKTAEEITKLYESFADGVSDPANLTVVLKALMEYCFGWQIQEQQRKATADAAINIYKQDLATAQATAVTAAAAMAEQKKIIERHEETIKAMFELCDVLAKEPAADPRTLTGFKKDKFDASKKREDRVESIASAIKKVREERKNQPA